MRNMMLQVKNLSKIALCASLLFAAALQAQAETTKAFSVSATKTVEFAPDNYTDGSKELFQWSDIEGISTAQSPWRVLSHEEWTYMLVTRDADKNALGQVDGKNGLIILPDGWTQPSGAPAFQPVSQGTTFDNNHYTATEWNLMKDAGAVFLPCRGYSTDGINIYDDTTFGAYWAATQYSDDNGYCVRFFDGYIHDQNNAAKTLYYSIRLVKDAGTPTAIESVEPSAVSNQKLLRNGQLYILREGKMYNAVGVEVK